LVLTEVPFGEPHTRILTCPVSRVSVSTIRRRVVPLHPPQVDDVARAQSHILLRRRPVLLVFAHQQAPVETDRGRHPGHHHITSVTSVTGQLHPDAPADGVAPCQIICVYWRGTVVLHLLPARGKCPEHPIDERLTLLVCVQHQGG